MFRRKYAKAAFLVLFSSYQAFKKFKVDGSVEIYKKCLFPLLLFLQAFFFCFQSTSHTMETAALAVYGVVVVSLTLAIVIRIAMA